MGGRWWTIVVAGLCLSAAHGAEATPRSKAAPKPAAGPLRVCPENPRYFTDGSSRAVYLTGAHTWNNLADMGGGDPPAAFDFDAYLDFLERRHHNFIRLWRWELVTFDTRLTPEFVKPGVMNHVAPHPWPRTGAGNALDGKPKFDLEQFDRAYFERLRSRVQAAGHRGIYVSVMLFEGWGLQHLAHSWKAHPFHKANNINGVDGDADGDGRGIDTHTLAVPAVTRLQEAYVRQVIDTVGDLDNVLYEIANESGAYSTDWQYHMIRFIKDYARKRPKQHPVGMTFQWSRDAKQRGTNRALLDSPADWISPNPNSAPTPPFNYRDNPPPADGKKVVLTDTDHLWGIGGNVAWVWKSFLRGLHPLFMDPYDGAVLGLGAPAQWDPVRRNLGDTLRYARRMNLAATKPRGDLATTNYCLANPAGPKPEYLVYLPEGGKVTVDLSGSPGKLAVEWFDPKTGKTSRAEGVAGGARRQFTAPFSGDAVLYLCSPP
jgi:hypothetical protein